MAVSVVNNRAGLNQAQMGPSSGPALFAALGDSIFGNSTAASSNSALYSSTGPLSWMQAFSMGALWMPMAWRVGDSTWALSYNRSVSGETAEQTLARVAELDALPVKPRFCCVLTGTNNLTSNTSQTADSIAAAIAAVSDAVLSRGITPILCTLLPRGNGTSAGWGALSAGQITTARGRLMEINRQLRNYAAANRNVILADVFNSVVNWSSTTSDPQVALLSDYLHPTAPGAYAIGTVMWAAVSPYCSPAPHSFFGTGDAYNATDNPYGSHIDSTWSAGGGTASTGTSGTVPSGWTTGRLSGSTSTAVIARQTRADGVNGNEVTITITGNDTATFRMYSGGSTLTNGNLPTAGEAFYAECDVRHNGTGANQSQNADLKVMPLTGSNIVHALYNNAYGNVAGDYTVRLRTPLIIAPVGGMTGTTSFWSLDNILASGTATVTRRNWGIRNYNRSAPGAVTWT